MNALKLGEQGEHLFDRIVSGDREALRELYISYSRRLTRFLKRFIRHDDLIEEVINDTFMVVWRNASAFRGEARLSTWIMGIAYRRGLKALNRKGHRWLDAVPVENETLLADDELGAAETREWVRHAVEQLPTEQRLTVELAYGQGYSCEEIGQIMQCPANTVKSRMFHARAKLRDILQHLGGTADARSDEGRPQRSDPQRTKAI